MKSTFMSRKWAVVLACGTITLLAATLFATQSLEFRGPLVPFADPTDSAGNDVIMLEFNFPEPHAETLPWHYHTGPLYGVVRQGTLIQDLGCGNVKEFPAGTAFHVPAYVVLQYGNAGHMEVQGTMFQLLPHGAPRIVVTPEPTCQ